MLSGALLGLVRRQVVRPLLNRVRRPLAVRGLARPREVSLLGLRLRTEPGVFHPLYFSSSRVLAEHAKRQVLPGDRVLDMGTGTGVIALTLAAAGAIVTACDVNPRAATLARWNAERNGLRLAVFASDLFAAIPGRTFDLIVFNIPFYPKDPATVEAAAWDAGSHYEVVDRFALGASQALTPGGRVMVVFSEDCDAAAIVGAFVAKGFALEDQRATQRVLELFFVASFRLPAARTKARHDARSPLPSG